MAKRKESKQTKYDREAKKRKRDRTVVEEPAVEIKSIDELKELLLFDQSYLPKLRRNVQTFQKFVVSTRKEAADSPQRKLLLQFLNSGAAAKYETAAGPFHSLFQTWSYALQTEHDDLLEGIPAALATLLETISNWLDFRDAGLQLCRALLQTDQMDVIEKCMKLNRKNATAVIECLKLLTQILSFDAGSNARKIFRHKNMFRQLEVLLDIRRPGEDAASKEKIVPPVRESAVRFFLANLRYQASDAKAELIGQGAATKTLFHRVADDPPALAREILVTAQGDVLDDPSLTASEKSRLVLETTLTQVAQLYRARDDLEDTPEDDKLANLAHNFLLTACAPKEDSFSSEGQTKVHGLGLVKFSSITVLLGKLRPHSSLLERSLVLTLFEAYPSLVSVYFKTINSFQFDPVLSATWIGYASFILAVVMQPLPTELLIKCSQKLNDADQKSIFETILPQPLGRSALEKSLTPTSDPIIVFFVARILVAAYDKLGRYLSSIRQSNPNFKTASKAVLDWFSQKCPRASLVVAAYKKDNQDSTLLKEQLSRLLLSYYSLTPKLVSETSFDVTTLLSGALEKVQSSDTEKYNELAQMQLSSLLRIAAYSPSMRWWKSPGSQLYSPFTSLIRTYVFEEPKNHETRDLIKTILQNHSILQPQRLEQALDGLIQSLEPEKEGPGSDSTFAFLDKCLAHLFQHDLKYTSRLFELVDSLDLRPDKEIPSFSLLSVTISEQWHFAVSAEDPSNLSRIAKWIVRFFEAMDDIGESRTILRSLQNELLNENTPEEVTTELARALPESKRLPLLSKSSHEPNSATATKTSAQKSQAAKAAADLEAKEALRAQLDAALDPPLEPENHPELTRWRRKDPSDALDDGIIADVASCLSSTHLDIRRQALTSLGLFIPTLQTSDVPTRQQLYLLLSELRETASATTATEPLPHLATALVRTAIPILQDPLHLLYPKLNAFLLLGPDWSVSRLPSYWLRAILHGTPSQDGAQARETSWLLDLLVEGLCSPADFDLYRSNGTFERVLARCAPGLVSPSIVAQALLLVYRCTFFTEGSTTLISRCGVLAWIEANLARCAEQNSRSGDKADGTGAPTSSGSLKATLSDAAGLVSGSSRRLALFCLLDRLVETADVARLGAWAGAEGVEGHVARMKKTYG